MCEPNLSIVQYPYVGDDGGRVEAILRPQETDADFWAKMKKRVGEWFHYAYLGFGHAEVLSRVTTIGQKWLPANTKYETQWWERQTRRDGLYSGNHLDAKEALEAATIYSQRVSTGNLTLLRSFLEMSIRKSARPHSYFDRFTAMLNRQGRDAFAIKVKRIVGITIHDIWYGFKKEVHQNLETLIKIMMGFTRKRNLLCPEWADDNLIWR